MRWFIFLLGLIFIVLLMVILGCFWVEMRALSPSSDGLRVVGFDVDGVQDRAFEERLQAYDARMARGTRYPLGDKDWFRIRHSTSSYCAFFRRMSPMVRVRLCQDEASGEIVATGCGVLRRVPADWRHPADLTPVWYLCDLRVDEAYRGRRLPFRMLMSAVARSYLRSRRCFGVTMENALDGVGKVGRLAGRVRAGPVRFDQDSAGRLAIYSVEAQVMQRAQPLLEDARGPLCYRSVVGLKDLILESTGQPMPLLHVNFRRFDSSLNLVNHSPNLVNHSSNLVNPQAEFLAPQDGRTHMFCLPEHDPICLLMKQVKINPTTYARIISYNMPSFDFAFLQTSEI